MTTVLKFCDNGDWLTWVFSFFLMYPYIVWAGYLALSWVLKSPRLMFISKVANPLTWLYAWGVAALLEIKRPAGQDCDLSYAVLDRGMMVAVVTVMTSVDILIFSHKNVSKYSVVSVGVVTLGYLIALNTNGYLSPLQFFFNVSTALVLSGFWSGLFVAFVRPFTASWEDRSLLGNEICSTAAL
jgi:hypothetical protein